MSKGFRGFQEYIPFSKKTKWLFDVYSKRNVKFVMVPNVELTILGRFRKESLLVHELQNKLSLKKGKEFQILEKFLRSNKIQLEDSIIKIAFLHYKEHYAYFQTFRKEKFNDLMRKKTRDLKRLYYGILDKYNFETYRKIFRNTSRTVEEFSNKILDEKFIPYKDSKSRGKYLEREDREIICDVFEYCQTKKENSRVIFLTNDKI